MTNLEKLEQAVRHYKTFPTKQNKSYIVQLANALEVER